MSLTNWLLKKRTFKNTKRKIIQGIEFEAVEKLWTKCEKCGLLMYHRALNTNYKVCLHCEHHFPALSKDRINHLIDYNSWQTLDSELVSTDPLGFTDQKLYRQRLQTMKEKTGLYDAVQTGLGKIGNIPIALGIMEFRFMGGSMGSVVGEKLTRLIETATKYEIPAIIICASGGARMQEGMLSLMQMAKISSALERHRKAKLLYIPILTSPTTGGVTASFAMLGDLIIAEPKALIAFAGRRVIEQTIGKNLPNNFQTSEYLFKHGFIDLIINRKDLRKKLMQILSLYSKPKIY